MPDSRMAPYATHSIVCLRRIVLGRQASHVYAKAHGQLANGDATRPDQTAETAASRMRQGKAHLERSRRHRGTTTAD